MKNILNRFISRCDTNLDRAGELERLSIEIIQPEAQKGRERENVNQRCKIVSSGLFYVYLE